MFILSRIFCGVSFVFYNFIGLMYVETVLSKIHLSKSKKLIMSIFNTLLYMGLSSFGLSVYVVYFCGFITLVVEFITIYRLTPRRVIYVASTFMFNIVATRNLVLSGFALVTFQPINQISGNSALYNFALSISFLILDIIMWLFIREKFVTFEDLTIFAKAKIQETYAAILSALILAYVMLFSSTHSYDMGNVDITVLNILTPITLATLYYVSFSYGIKMGKSFEMERKSRALESELKETKESKVKLEHIAYVDPLTNAYSRRYCLEKIEQLLEDDVGFSLCFIDVDGLKMVNDTYGHAEGDIYLQMIADVLRNILRRDDVISRIGGDEFVILLPQCPRGTALKRIKTAHEQVMSLRQERTLLYDACISYGVIEVPYGSGEDVEELLAQADKKMYEFKIKQKKISYKNPRGG